MLIFHIHTYTHTHFFLVISFLATLTWYPFSMVSYFSQEIRSYLLLDQKLFFYCFLHFFLLFKYRYLRFFPTTPPVPPILTSHFWCYPSLALSMCLLYMFLDDPFPFPHFIRPLWLLSVCSLFPRLWLCFACWFVLLIRFHLQVRSYGICLSLPDLFHLAQCSPVPSMLLWRAGAPFFFLLHSIPLCKCTTVS